MRTSVPGVATGLAWTPVGGDILFIEATRIPGHGGLILTGQLGDVMRESAQAALTLVKSRAAQLGIDPALFEKSDIHVHVPGRRHAEGRTERRRCDVHGARLTAHQSHGAKRHRHDRRDLAARPGAAGRRHQGKSRRCRRGRAEAGDAAGAKPAGLRRNSARRPRQAANSSGWNASTMRSPRALEETRQADAAAG